MKHQTSRIIKWFHAFINSLWLELFVAIASAILSISVNNADNTDQNNLVSQAISAITYAIIGGAIPLLIRLHLRLGKTTSTLESMENIIHNLQDLENRLLPNLYVPDKMKFFHEQWINWKKSLSSHGNIGELEEMAWTLLAEAYLTEESKRIESKYVLTNTNRYTMLVSDASKYLESHHGSETTKENQQIVRYHITGMLPEEFYNGSQIEFTANSSKPIFFNHKWEEYQDFYDSEYQGGNQKIRIMRCIVVRKQNLTREEISALSTITDLQEQAGLVIINRERRVVYDLPNEADAVQKRLFRKCSSEQQRKYKELMTSILGRNSYKYWPIVNADDHDCADNNQWKSLFDVFAKDFHNGKPEDASYCILTEGIWAKIKSKKLAKSCFKPGWLPEIVLFGKSINNEIEWCFGISGHWRPFTSDIELHFLNKEQSSQLYNDFTIDICQEKNNKGKLLSLKKDRLSIST